MVELLNTDCMEYMKGLPDNSFDIAIVDPPYGIGWDAMQVDYGEGTKERNGWTKKMNKYKKAEWDIKPDKHFFDELFRVSKNQIIWGYNHFELPPTKSVVFWDKNTGNFSFGDGELAWCSLGGAVRKFEYTWAGFRKGPNGNKREKRHHPTQKPYALYAWLIKTYCQPGWKILDTHLGSGSSAIVAEKMGFDFVGCEIDKEYYNAAVKRFNKETDLGMFNVRTEDATETEVRVGEKNRN